MPSVIDTLVIELGLDPTKFTQGQRSAMAAIKQLEEQATKSGKETEAHSKKLLDFFVNVKREVLGLVGAFYGGRGIADMVQHITRLDASAARIGNVTRTSAHDIAVWRIALQEVGGSAEEADSAIKGLSDTIEDWKLRPDQMNPEALALFGMIGARSSDIPTDILRKLADYSQTPQMRAHPEQFAARARMLPGMTDNMINLLMELPARLAEAQKAVPEGGGLGKFSEDFIKTEALFEAAVTNFSRAILEYLVPVMKDIMALLPSWMTSGGGINWSKVSTDLGESAAKEREELASSVGTWLWDHLFGDQSPSGKWKAKQAAAAGTSGTGTVSKSSGNYFDKDEEILGVDVMPSPRGARGAAAASSVNNSRSSKTTNTTTTDVNIGTLNVNAPNATDVNGASAAGVKGALGTSIGAPLNGAY